MSDYPLVGPEEAVQVSSDVQASWDISLKLQSIPSPEKLSSLLEGIDELVSNDPRLLENQVDVGRVGLRGNFPQTALAQKCWQVSVSELDLSSNPGAGLVEGELETWTFDGVTKRIAVLRPSSLILKNTALIQQIRRSQSNLDGVVVETTGCTEADPELLVHQTIQLMSGLLGGATALRVTQSESEPFSSLWSRLNIARLLKWEAQLGDVAQCTQGAGLFSELQKKL